MFDRLQTLGRYRLPFDDLIPWIVQRRIGLLLVVGVVFRLAQYFAGRWPWMDEYSLADNLEVRTPVELLGPLKHTQLAPPGFLYVEWLLRWNFGPSYYSLRLYPLLGGIAALVLFQRLARQILIPTSALIALALFTSSDDLIYFSSEVKQYSTDVAIAISLMNLGLSGHRGIAGPRFYFTFAVAGAIALWFSHPSAFVLAGIGTTRLVSATVGRRWREFGWLVGACVVWTASFAVVHAIARRQLGDPQGMNVFWSFAFPPNSPKSFDEWLWWPRRLAYLALNPLGFNTPFGWPIFAIPAVALHLVGLIAMARSDRERFAMLFSPMAFTMAATSLHLYPFHGRLVLFLVPIWLIFIAEGARVVGERFHRKWIWWIVLGSILGATSTRDLYHLAVYRDRDQFNPVGDRDPYRIHPDRAWSQRPRW